MELAVDHRTPPLSPPPVRHPGGGPGRADALRDVLAELGERVRPVVLARDRALSVAPAFDQLLPDGLVRGQVVSCHGAAQRSTAFALVRDSLVAGGWMAVIDVATFGTDAAAELGVPLERVVRIDTGVEDAAMEAAEDAAVAQSATDLAHLAWIDVMGAAIDGFDLILTRVPAALGADRRPAAVRKLRSRLQQKGAVVVTLGSPGALGGDVELTTQRTVWSGLGDGAGLLRRRVIDVEATGRRLPGTRSCSIELTGTGNRVDVAAPALLDRDVLDRDVSDRDVRDPQAELLAEMAGVQTLADDAVAGETTDRLAG